MPTPYNVCNGSVAAGTAAVAVAVGTCATGTSPGTVAIGDLVYITCGDSGTETVSTVSDGTANVYAKVIGQGSSAQHLEIWACIATVALTSADTLTVTWSGTTGARMFIARGCPGVLSATADQAVSAGATSAGPASSGATAALAQASELVVGAVQNAAAGSAPTSPSFGSVLSVSNGAYCSEFDEVVSSTAAQTASASLTASCAWAAAIATFELTVVIPPVIPPVVFAGQSIQRSAAW